MKAYTWTEAVEELAARITEEIHKPVEENDLRLDIALGGIYTVRDWLLAQPEPGGPAVREDSEPIPFQFPVCGPPGSVQRSEIEAR